MSLLKNPIEIADTLRLAGLVYGQPGVGKTTLALSAPNPVLVDADNGMRRVEKRFQVPSLPLSGYGVLLELLESAELDPFETLVIDTLGRLIERIGDHIAADNPAYRQKDGSLSLKGFGKLRIEFQRLLRLAQDHQKHLIFVAHDKEERDGDARIVRPDTGPGSSGKDLVKDLDFMGYMEMRGNDRTISFSPCERYYAKNALGLDSVIKVPDIKNGNGNTFIRDLVIERATDRMIADHEENKKYTELLTAIGAVLAKVADPKTAEKALAYINTAPVIWDSQRVAKRRLADRTKEVGVSYDRVAKKFVKAQPEEDEETDNAVSVDA